MEALSCLHLPESDLLMHRRCGLERLDHADTQLVALMLLENLLVLCVFDGLGQPADVNSDVRDYPEGDADTIDRITEFLDDRQDLVHVVDQLLSFDVWKAIASL